MNNIIQLDRLASLLKLQLSTNGRTLLLKLATLVVVVCLIYIFANMVTFFSGDYVNFESGLISARFMTILASGFMWVSMISLSFVPYFNKGVAAASFMLPATSTEKFVTQWFISMVIVPVVIVAVITLNDFAWTQYLVGMASGESVSYTVEPSILSYFSFFEEYPEVAFAVISVMIMQSVLVFLGSVIFLRAQMMWTILSLTIIETTIAYILGWVSLRIEHPNDHDLAIVISVVSIIVTLAALFLAWQRFTRLQIKN